jgi:hypothetical protein
MSPDPVLVAIVAMLAILLAIAAVIVAVFSEAQIPAPPPRLIRDDTDTRHRADIVKSTSPEQVYDWREDGL